MCGIVGIISNEKVDINALNRAVNSLIMRGPNSQNCWLDENVGLAHSRLSIQDLSHNANQPMHSSCGRYVLVYNGEIYNFNDLKNELDYNWKTHSDTEVIVEMYKRFGKSCIDKFNGMFSFAIWDNLKKELFCARDRMGEKPFYYSFYNNEFVFASRPTALFELSDIPKEINDEALRLYTEIGYIPSELSIYDNIKMLPPAHTLTLSENQLIIERYWDYRQIETDYTLLKVDEEILLDELDELLTSSVKMRMVSDVPIGAFLSGGIDSSIVCAIMSKLSKEDIHTFSIGFYEKLWDESTHAENVARYLNTKHYMEKLSINDLLELMNEFTKNFDEPFFDSSAFPTMAVSKLSKKYVDVVLTGDGADEIFGGYHYYHIIDTLKYIYFLPRGVRSCISKLLSFLPNHKFKLLSQAINKQNIISAFAFSRSIKKDYDDVLLNNILTKSVGIENYFLQASKTMPKKLNSAEVAMRLDAFYTLPDEYLQKVDIASMAYSLETRTPFLDHRIVEWAAKLPYSLKYKNGQNKYLLRKLAYRYISRDILDRPKQGFSVPVSQWLRYELKNDFLDKINLQNDLHKKLNISNIGNLFQLHFKQKRDIHPLLWAIYSLLIWKESRENE